MNALQIELFKKTNEFLNDITKVIVWYQKNERTFKDYISAGLVLRH